jgi:ATP-dependent 26S proteasome regulatory subunit
MNDSVENIKTSIKSGQVIIKIISYEENRVEKFLSALNKQTFNSTNNYYWDINNGLNDDTDIIPDTKSPVKAIDFVLKEETPKGFFVFRDLSPLLSDSKFDSVPVNRKIREAFVKLKKKGKIIFLLSSDEFFPDMIKKEIDVIRFALPDYNELETLFLRFLDSIQRSGKQIELSDDEKTSFITAVMGLTYEEAYKAFMKTLLGKQVVTIDLISKINEEKKQLILKDGVLEYYTNKLSLDDLGGLGNIKDWLKKRKKAFSKEAEAYGLQKPRGVLSMGISGCGKSLTAKIISGLWDLPLFRLDMNLVYSGMGGSPELVFSRALKTMDTVAPAILWIDEIESGISDKQSDSASSRILGFFLTWMQEHTSDIFIAATANRIDLLPAELLRRGRFDQIFFIDLPTHKEREEIFSIHLKGKGNDLDNFNIPQLAQITKGWSGSEIEQAIISASYEAFSEDRKLMEDDLFIIFGNTVPLSTTMNEQIKKIRSWAHNRAVRASKDIEY